MTYNVASTTSGANFIPQFWLNEVIANYKANAVMRGAVRVINHNKKKGDTLYIPNFTRSLAVGKVPGTPVAFISDPTHGVTTINLNQHYVYGKIIEDILDLQALSPLLRQTYMDDAGYAIARKVDFLMHVQAGSLNGGTADTSPGTEDANTITVSTSAYIGSDGSTAWSSAGEGNGAALADAGVRRLMRRLDDNNFPVTGRTWVVPPVVRESLLGIPRYTEQAFQGSGAPIRTGQIGSLYGDPVAVSTECLTTTDANGTQSFRVALYLHESAICLAEQQAPRAQQQYFLDYLGVAFTVDTVFGTAELRNTGGYQVVVPA